MNQQSSKLQAKDLITVGIFTAIYFVIFLACAMLGFIPIFLLAMTFYGPVITGIPFISSSLSPSNFMSCLRMS